eukprot:3938212-Amphidinium_carterae.1
MSWLCSAKCTQPPPRILAKVQTDSSMPTMRLSIKNLRCKPTVPPGQSTARSTSSEKTAARRRINGWSLIITLCIRTVRVDVFVSGRLKIAHCGTP